ncbi:hypothetical protein Xmlh_10250 [Xanthomonas axonopodis pv. melhusii]|uniref:Uncharacterized protein n=1 Tax=Xanthomonas axonopodis pv. melhusii TaxID=487834 RepID=A0A1T1P311_9XANT|nr:hypothetical protein Xmlh_10250 [Xanthomonas axonopodis pv. melhusii]
MPLLGILWVEAKPPQRTHSTATQVAGCRVQRRFSALDAFVEPEAAAVCSLAARQPPLQRTRARQLIDVNNHVVASPDELNQQVCIPYRITTFG